MQYTSSEAAKLLQKLNEELGDIQRMESMSSSFNAALGEDIESVRPEYDFETVQDRIAELQEKIRRVKHAINVFNCSQVVPGFDMTIDQILILIPQLNREKAKLDGMAGTLPKVRETAMGGFRGGSSPVIDYRYTNYEIADAKKAFEAVSDRLAKAQMALDRVNTTERFEIDLEI
ncbi:MAG: hypothetical protein Q4C63_04540 [Eubacteriales bacterium]|nr:hypothetical protein [Eubacteriales bacterium]